MVSFCFSTGLNTENHVVSAVDPSGRDVPIQSLDQTFLDTGRIPALIKLDVEGYKAEVLRGANAFGGTWPQGHPNRVPLTSRGQRVKECRLDRGCI